jgi:retron-type reverse transcriptase
LDIEKAFDTTWHTGLLYKLSKFDFSVSLIKLISSFLYKRKFFVSVEGETSTPRIMKAGVPQASILSPTLFNISVNNTPQAIGVHLALFADDICLHATERKEGYVLKNFSMD